LNFHNKVACALRNLCRGLSGSVAGGCERRARAGSGERRSRGPICPSSDAPRHPSPPSKDLQRQPIQTPQVTTPAKDEPSCPDRTRRLAACGPTLMVRMPFNYARPQPLRLFPIPNKPSSQTRMGIPRVHNKSTAMSYNTHTEHLHPHQPTPPPQKLIASTSCSCARPPPPPRSPRFPAPSKTPLC